MTILMMSLTKLCFMTRSLGVVNATEGDAFTCACTPTCHHKHVHACHMSSHACNDVITGCGECHRGGCIHLCMYAHMSSHACTSISQGLRAVSMMMS